MVHLDELEPYHATWIAPFLKLWADEYAFQAEVKGGAFQLRPERFIITSNYSIDQMGWDAITTAAIKRRYTEIKKINGQNIIL